MSVQSNALLNHLSGEPRIVVIHSSLLGLPRGGKWRVLSALDDIVRKGWTIAIPAFSFSFCGGADYHHLHSHPETGVLASWVQQRRDATRTPHPIYSFVVVGPYSTKIEACQNSTTFSADSPFGLFVESDAVIMMVGCSWQSCTLFHFFEEEARVPYRFYKTFSGKADFGSGRLALTQATMYARNLDLKPEVENDFSPAFDAIRRDGAMKSTLFMGLEVDSTTGQRIAATCRDLLKGDPFSFVRQGRAVERSLLINERREAAKPMKVALVAQHNVDILGSAVSDKASVLIEDQSIDVYVPPFGQGWAQVMTDSSDLWRLRPDYLFFLARIEDLAGSEDIDASSATLEDAVDRYLDVLRSAGSKLAGRVFAAALFPGAPGSHRTLATQDGGSNDVASKANRSIQALEGVTLVDLERALLSEATGPIHDKRLWYLGRIPYSAEATKIVAKQIVGTLLAATGRTARLLVVDLDNTLWGGVIGDDGLEGIQLGGDYPGNAYRAFQQVLKNLAARGIALAIVSKNDENVALNAMSAHPDMLIREDDLAAYRINWQPKWQNLLEIADEVSLGLENVMFIDDNPAERAAMRLHLPAVQVLDLPKDPADYVRALMSSPHLECITLTEEDRGRSSRYVARRRAEAERARYSNPEDFYAALGIKLHIAELGPTNFSRTAQLIVKTNQFNTTGRRYSEDELRRLPSEGASVYVLGHEDKYTEVENIGAVVVKWFGTRTAEVDLFVMSCRVLGRGIETAFMMWLGDYARSRSVVSLRGQIVETERNTPVRDLFARCGFSEAREGWWSLDLRSTTSSQPRGLTIVDHTKTKVAS